MSNKTISSKNQKKDRFCLGLTWEKINKELNDNWRLVLQNKMIFDHFHQQIVLPLMKKAFGTKNIECSYIAQGATGYDLCVQDEVFTFF